MGRPGRSPITRQPTIFAGIPPVDNENLPAEAVGRIPRTLMTRRDKEGMVSAGAAAQQRLIHSFSHVVCFLVRRLGRTSLRPPLADLPDRCSNDHRQQVQDENVTKPVAQSVGQAWPENGGDGKSKKENAYSRRQDSRDCPSPEIWIGDLLVHSVFLWTLSGRIETTETDTMAALA